MSVVSISLTFGTLVVSSVISVVLIQDGRNSTRLIYRERLGKLVDSFLDLIHGEYVMALTGNLDLFLTDDCEILAEISGYAASIRRLLPKCLLATIKSFRTTGVYLIRTIVTINSHPDSSSTERQAALRDFSAYIFQAESLKFQILGNDAKVLWTEAHPNENYQQGGKKEHSSRK